MLADPGPHSHCNRPARRRPRWLPWLLLGVLLAAAVHTPASGETVGKSKTLPPKQLIATHAPAEEAPRWRAVGGASVVADTDAVLVDLPAQAEAALTREFPPEDADWGAYPSLQIEATALTSGQVSVTLTDADGKTFSQVLPLRAGHNRRQFLLKEIRAALDPARLHSLTLGTPEPTANAPLTERRFRLQQITLAPELSGIAEEIQNAWYFYYLSRYGYFAFFLILMAISFGVPLPEEIFHLTAGYLAYLTKTNPEVGINVHIIAPVNMFSTLVGDIFIYFLGRTKGEKIRKWRWFHWVMPDAAFVKVRQWFDRWGVGATFMFRFLPPIRMPGYFASGLLRQSPLAFIAADGLACLISVPTQIYLVYFYGDYIIDSIKNANFMIAVVAGVLVVLFIGYKLATRKKRKAEKAAAEAMMHSPAVEAAIADHKSATGIPILDGADAQHLHIKHLHVEGSEHSSEPASSAQPPPQKPGT